MGLSISRKTGECFVIYAGGDAIVVGVSQISRARVVVNIEGPPWCKVLRGELIDTCDQCETLDCLSPELRRVRLAEERKGRYAGEAASGEDLPPKICEPCVMCEARDCMKGSTDAAQTAAG